MIIANKNKEQNENTVAHSISDATEDTAFNRLTKERLELMARLNQLTAYLTSFKVLERTQTEIELLCEQHIVMGHYLAILNYRLDHWNKYNDEGSLLNDNTVDKIHKIQKSFDEGAKALADFDKKRKS